MSELEQRHRQQWDNPCILSEVIDQVLVFVLQATEREKKERRLLASTREYSESTDTSADLDNLSFDSVDGDPDVDDDESACGSSSMDKNIAAFDSESSSIDNENLMHTRHNNPMFTSAPAFEDGSHDGGYE